MNILFFTKGDKTVPSSRYRVWLVAERLHKHYGWKYEILHSIGYASFSVSCSRLNILVDLIRKLKAKSSELIFVHKSLFPWDVVVLLVAAKKFLGKKLAYDLDDAEWLHSPRKSVWLARNADVVFCGSHEILAWAQRYNKNTVFMPTVVDAELYAAHAVSHGERHVLTIGWLGQGRAHMKAGNFHILKEALLRLHSSGVSFRFVLAVTQHHQPLHDFFSDVPFEVVCIDEANWVVENTAPKIISHYQFDIGVMPLTDTPFNRAKCAFKAIEYMACGVPVVASPVGENSVVIENGKNGFLARTTEEWIHAFKTLAKDHNLRNTMGAVGMEKIKNHYSYEAVLERYAETLEEVCKRA